MKKPNCKDCRYFFITWNQKTPYGCKNFMIQSKEMPSHIVAMAGSGECMGFTPKINNKNEEKKLDLNRDDLW